MNKSDLRLKQDIDEELNWDPKINAAQIGVTVDHGAVSLQGDVDTYAEKWAAEDAVKRVAGVRTVAQDLKVKLTGEHVRSDAEIASAALNALKWDVFVPSTVTARIQNALVTLEGEVANNYQREAAERSVRFLRGVAFVTNLITLKPQKAGAAQVKAKVQAALLRQATDDAASIHIETSGGRVTLTGHASSWQALKDASTAAWAVPGVTEVVDKMNVATT